MCELQDSCQTEHCFLNTSSKELRVGLVLQGEAKPSPQLADGKEPGSWLDPKLIFLGRLEATVTLLSSLSAWLDFKVPR